MRCIPITEVRESHRKLMDAMVTFARAKGVRSIALEVRESNQGARNLYESYGFRQEAVRKGYYHNPRRGCHHHVEPGRYERITT